MTTNGKKQDSSNESLKVRRALQQIAAKKKARSKRIPIGTQRLKLDVKPKEGYCRRWFNDKDNRLSQAAEGGYSFVEADNFEHTHEDLSNRNEAISSYVSKAVGGEGAKIYLMEIKEEHYLEDQKAKEQHIKAKEQNLRNGSDKNGRVGQDGRYIPEGGISIERKAGL